MKNKFKGECRSKLCNLVGLVNHSQGTWKDGFHEGMRTMYEYMIKNKVTRPKIDWVKEWILQTCNKRTEPARPLIKECTRKYMCQDCKEKFEVIEKLCGSV